MCREGQLAVSTPEIATQQISTHTQRELIGRLTRLVARRAKDEVEIRQRHVERDAEAHRQFERDRQAATAQFEREHSQLIGAWQESREKVYRAYEKAGGQLAVEEHDALAEAKEGHAESLEVAKNVWQHRRDDIESAYTIRQAEPHRELSQFETQCAAKAAELETLVAEAQRIVRRRCAWPGSDAPPPIAPAGLTRQQHVERILSAIGRARAKVAELQHSAAGRFLEDGSLVLVFIFALVLAAIVCGYFLWHLGWIWVACAAVGAAIVITLLVRQAVVPLARRHTRRVVPEFQLAVEQAHAELKAVQDLARRETGKRERKLLRRRERGLVAAQADWEKTCREEADRQEAQLRQTAAEFQVRRATIEDPSERELDAIATKYPPLIDKLERDFQRRISELSASYRSQRVAGQQQFEREWNELVASWTAGLAEFQQVIGSMNEFCDDSFPPWDDVLCDSWQPPAAGVPALRFGRFDLDLESLEGGLPQDGELELPPASFRLPAVLSFPDCPSLLLEAEGDGRDAATRLIQNVMLRLLTTFPPGKVRFTIIDPVGLGQNFSAFMHLADYDQRLVTSRIWTESTHINQRLADLTEHMENVIQKYLRNEFASIQEYNQQAGEVAEPFQILVVANFPANFSDEAARRLVSIASSGARCGVYTLISVDTKLGLPRNFDLADLESQAATLVWNQEQQRFCWKHDDLRRWPLAVEGPPADEQFTEIVRAVGRQAKDTSRVEVPFETVLPAQGQWWTAESTSEIEVPLGRAGAMKLQYLRLGKGTSQHVLIAGKTGSGKSTLLNATITNLAAHYSPDELEFYLIDFKKGVEFKAYAAHKLPHARVIAIESEREFGLSVLERLDLELKRRGDLFRQAAVQDVKGYRAANPDARMPRILLVIDEFQEFFTSDDKISHDAALLLDRLVRQGRAFGIHVLLGSQTLAGAYSLARSTIGQMAVRIALQCSESDAHLILSEDNTAARLLGRPGEAIYNDANGLFEGNHPFQVVWISDHQRETYLQRVAELAAERNVATLPSVVFEGNVAADIAENQALRTLLEQSPPSAVPLAPRAWLGAAVAIKDPTEAVFRRQGGSNLLVVGQHEEQALGVLASGVISLAAQLPPAAAPNASFFILDGTRPESPEAGFWRRMCEQLPFSAQVAMPRDAVQILSQLAAEVERRMAGGEHAGPPQFLVLFNLARFRDLKKSDDFGGFGDDDAAGAGKHLTTILREGPAVGVHVLIWCESYNNLNRWLDRQTLRDLELRVLFQMSAADSSNLMDSPAASRLGVHRAIFYSEELGQAEKFRPYGVPSSAWLTWLQERLTHGSTGSASPEQALESGANPPLSPSA
jgi:hypothetical protein